MSPLDPHKNSLTLSLVRLVLHDDDEIRREDNDRTEVSGDLVHSRSAVSSFESLSFVSKM